MGVASAGWLDGEAQRSLGLSEASAQLGTSWSDPVERASVVEGEAGAVPEAGKPVGSGGSVVSLMSAVGAGSGKCLELGVV